MQALEGSVLNFTIDNVRKSLWYDILVRYEPKHYGSWDDAQMIIERDEPVDPNGPCADWYPDQDRLRVELPTNQRSSMASKPVCLEDGKTYTVLLELNKFNGPTDAGTPSVLVDSVRSR